ncbi:hypothetical protein SDC9_73859 [bioreactor metagenome]|uniref:Uncharacterized protein n=1 Tax=bioreactor metagenome TaxID=1076179 RepID=A0A644YG89_9ZZZZ
MDRHGFIQFDQVFALVRQAEPFYDGFNLQGDFDPCFEQKWVVPELLQAFVEGLNAYAYVHDLLAGTLPLAQKRLDRFILQIQEMDQHSPSDRRPFELQRKQGQVDQFLFPVLQAGTHLE